MKRTLPIPGGKGKLPKKLVIPNERCTMVPKPFKRRITVSSAKAKARWLQNWACEKISQLTNVPWGYEDDKEIQPRIMGQKGVDVVLRGQAADLFPYAVECSSGEQWSVPRKVKQAKKNLKLPYDKWLLILKKKDMQEPIVVMPATHFFYLKACELYGKRGK